MAIFSSFAMILYGVNKRKLCFSSRIFHTLTVLMIASILDSFVNEHNNVVLCQQLEAEKRLLPWPFSLSSLNRGQLDKLVPVYDNLETIKPNNFEEKLANYLLDQIKNTISKNADKRAAFSPWAGKRSPEISENFLGLKDHELPPESSDEDVNKRPSFHSWSGKRANKRPSFHSWSGKRADKRRPFHAWSGKRTSADENQDSDRTSFSLADNIDDSTRGDLIVRRMNNLLKNVGENDPGYNMQHTDNIHPEIVEHFLDNPVFDILDDQQLDINFANTRKRAAFSPWAGKRSVADNMNDIDTSSFSKLSSDEQLLVLDYLISEIENEILKSSASPKELDHLFEKRRPFHSWGGKRGEDNFSNDDGEDDSDLGFNKRTSSTSDATKVLLAANAAILQSIGSLTLRDQKVASLLPSQQGRLQLLLALQTVFQKLENLNKPRDKISLKDSDDDTEKNDKMGVTKDLPSSTPKVTEKPYKRLWGAKTRTFGGRRYRRPAFSPWLGKRSKRNAKPIPQDKNTPISDIYALSFSKPAIDNKMPETENIISAQTKSYNNDNGMKNTDQDPMNNNEVEKIHKEVEVKDNDMSRLLVDRKESSDSYLSDEVPLHMIGEGDRYKSDDVNVIKDGDQSEVLSYSPITGLFDYDGNERTFDQTSDKLAPMLVNQEGVEVSDNLISEKQGLRQNEPQGKIGLIGNEIKRKETESVYWKNSVGVTKKRNKRSLLDDAISDEKTEKSIPSATPTHEHGIKLHKPTFKIYSDLVNESPTSELSQAESLSLNKRPSFHSWSGKRSDTENPEDVKIGVKDSDSKQKYAKQDGETASHFSEDMFKLLMNSVNHNNPSNKVTVHTNNDNDESKRPSFHSWSGKRVNIDKTDILIDPLIQAPNQGSQELQQNQGHLEGDIEESKLSYLHPTISFDDAPQKSSLNDLDKRPAFHAWSGKRFNSLAPLFKRPAFHSWSGKRTTDNDLEKRPSFHSWSGKRGIPLSELYGYDTVLDSIVKNKRPSFHSWSGKRDFNPTANFVEIKRPAFQAWSIKRGEKRPSFHSWSGKRYSNPTDNFVEAKRPSFHAWSGKRYFNPTDNFVEAKRPSFHAWSGKRYFNPTDNLVEAKRPSFHAWSGKRYFNPTDNFVESKRPAFHAWSGKRNFVEEKRPAFHAWSGKRNFIEAKRPAFHAWSGKRYFNPADNFLEMKRPSFHSWSGKRYFNPTDDIVEAKRPAFHAWSGKRDTDSQKVPFLNSLLDEWNLVPSKNNSSKSKDKRPSFHSWSGKRNVHLEKSEPLIGPYNFLSGRKPFVSKGRFLIFEPSVSDRSSFQKLLTNRAALGQSPEKVGSWTPSLLGSFSKRPAFHAWSGKRSAPQMSERLDINNESEFRKRREVPLLDTHSINS